MEATVVRWKVGANEQGCGKQRSCWCVHPLKKYVELGIITLYILLLEVMNSYCVTVQWMEATVVQGRWEERIRLWRANEFVANTKLFVRTPR